LANSKQTFISYPLIALFKTPDMKKIILTLTALLTIFSLTAFAYLNWGNSVNAQTAQLASDQIVDSGFDLTKIIGQEAGFELLYKVDSRFLATVTKEKLLQAKSIADILPEEATQDIVSYFATEVSVLEKDRESDHLEKGNSETLNEAQVKLLQSADYSNNIFISANYKMKKLGSDQLEDKYLTYYITVIPEQEAEYTSGYQTLISYLKENSTIETAIIEQNQLKPGRVDFTITKEGTVTNVRLTSTSGYPTVDKKLVELISKMPGRWYSATDANGEKVEQEFIFFFGFEGC
jgi:hypothetical protein